MGTSVAARLLALEAEFRKHLLHVWADELAAIRAEVNEITAEMEGTAAFLVQFDHYWPILIEMMEHQPRDPWGTAFEEIEEAYRKLREVEGA
jgi:hypothetical protein